MEKEIFTSIPKFFNNDKLQFTNSKFTEFFYRDRFWVSITYFYVCLIAMVYYLISSGVFFNSIFKFSIFICGILTWTMLEYYFHRIGLHEDFNNLNHLNGHYIHHSFPNLKNKLALSPTKITFQAGLIFLALVFIGRL